jgi:hypothetical protein
MLWEQKRDGIAAQRLFRRELTERLRYWIFVFFFSLSLFPVVARGALAGFVEDGRVQREAGSKS